MQTPNGWQETEKGLAREFQFESFSDAVVFINKVAKIADGANHHPEIWNSYTKVKLTLFTHDAGAVTAKDIELAEKINTLT